MEVSYVFPVQDIFATTFEELVFTILIIWYVCILGVADEWLWDSSGDNTCVATPTGSQRD